MAAVGVDDDAGVAAVVASRARVTLGLANAAYLRDADRRRLENMGVIKQNSKK